METWKMIKELTENPDKKFMYITAGEIGTVENIGGAILLTEINGREENKALKLHSGFMKQDWQEVKEPVEFAEVLKNRDVFSVEHEFISKSNLGEVFKNMYLDEFLVQLNRHFSNDGIRKILLEGKFYIGILPHRRCINDR